MSAESNPSKSHSGVQSSPELVVQPADSVKSGESAFKVFSFDPKHKDQKNYQKCKDFWEFIDSRPDLKPIRGFKMVSQRSPKKTESEMDKTEEEKSWTDILQVLVNKGLTKAARVAGSSSQCKMCRFEKFQAYEESEDVFDLRDLNDFDPQRKILVDGEVQTDAITTRDVETQTDVKQDWEIALEEQQRRMRELSVIMQSLNYENAPDLHPAKCTCDDCKCQLTQLDKCTCSCGEAECKCTECARLLEEIDRASQAYETLDKNVVDRCACSSNVHACLMDMSKYLRARLQHGQFTRTEWCTCGQTGCPCDLMVNVVEMLDQIFVTAEEWCVENAEVPCVVYYEKILVEGKAKVEISDVSVEIKNTNLCVAEDDGDGSYMPGPPFSTFDGSVPSGILPSVNWGSAPQP